MDFAPVTLEGRHIRLERLSLAHVARLCAVGFDDSIWRWNPRPPVRTHADMQRYVESTLAARDEGLALSFATLDQETGRPIGSTRFHGPITRAATSRSATPGSRRLGSAPPPTPKPSS